MIWLLRHGEAEDAASDDASRRLTAKGERQSRAAGSALAALRVELDACLSSPKARALETARIACVELKKGGLAGIDEGSLVTLLRPAQVRRIAGS